MKKIMGSIAGSMLAGIMLLGCGEKDIAFNVNELGDKLNSQIEYQDELGSIDVESAGMFLNLSNVELVNGSIYEGSGATAEEIVVLECASEAAAANAQKAIEERVAEQKDSFADYVPEELTKLDAAVIRVSGKYVILSVSNDPDKASDIIAEYIK